jgi:hypothetical protein
MKNYHWLIIFLIISACKSTSKTTVEVKIEPIKNETKRILSDKYIWYHPNEWWKINAEPFPVSKDSFAYRTFFPQYGYPYEFSNGKWIDSTYRKWKVYNQFNCPQELGGHAWNIFVDHYKEIFKVHPEYLSEVDGNRLGFGKTTKLCVTNPEVKRLYTQYVFEKIQKSGNESLVVSIEPSDGAKHCSCSKCNELGSISNKVFYFANEVAKNLKVKYPKAKLSLNAYYQHALPPSFPIEKNIIVIVSPNGFQQEFSPEAMLVEWKDKVSELTYYEYFGIPQYTGDLPKIEIEKVIKKLELIKRLGYQGCTNEAGINFNALILLNLWNRYMMYPDKGWEFVYNKFLDDCFPSSKEDMNRLFYRWHHVWLEKNEFSASLYDLQQATYKTKDTLELERLRDIKAYVHYMILYIDWTEDIKNVDKAAKLLKYVHSVNQRKICNFMALKEIVFNQFKSDTLFISTNNWPKMSKIKSNDTWITSIQIEQNFQDDLKSYPPKKLNLDYSSAIETIDKMNVRKDQYLKEYNATFTNSKSIDIITEKDLQIFATKINMNDAKSKEEFVITIQNKDLTYIKTYIINKGHNYNIVIPKKDQYRLTFNRMNATVASICGEFIPVFSVKSITNWTAFKYYYPDEQNKWKLAVKNQIITHRLPELFILAKP